MGIHGSVFCNGDANLTHVQQTIKDEVNRLVGQGRIADSGPYALETLPMQFAYAQVFVGRISLQLLTHKQMHFLCGSFCQAVVERLY